jgi:uncharacterized protein YjbI with pentapeptide repeats
VIGMAKPRGLEAPRLTALRMPRLEDADTAGDLTEETFETARLRFTGGGSADLSFSALSESTIEGAHAEQLQAPGVSFNEVVVSELDVVTWRGRDSTWRDVEIGPGRIGSIDLSNSELRAVRFSGLRLGYCDLGAARLTDVEFIGCTFGALDLPSATLARVRFTECTVDELDLRMTECASVDIRGLEIGARLELAGRNGRAPLTGIYASPEQARDLAPVLARTVGLSLVE